MDSNDEDDVSSLNGYRLAEILDDESLVPRWRKGHLLHSDL